MAQDFVKGWISGHLRREEQEKVRSALARMGLRDDLNEWETLRWELLNWFVSFAQRDIAALTEEQCSQLDEEVQVIQLLASFNLNPWVPNREDLHVLAQRILTILSGLVETGCVRIGPLPVEFVVWRGAERQADIPEAQLAKGFVIYEGWGPALLGHPPAEGIGFQVPPTGIEALIHCLAQLLSKYPSAVRRCRHCKKLFTRVRVKANLGQEDSCSRTCQTRSDAQARYRENKAAAEKKRRKAEARKRRMELRKRRAPNKKKGKAHGTKKRTR